MTHPRSQGSPDRRTSFGPADLGVSIDGLLTSFYQRAEEEAVRYNLTATEFNLLRVCLRRQEECTATELAQILPVDTSRISRMVTILVDRGLLRRRRLPSDRRMVMLSLSEEGVELTSRILDSINMRNTRLLEGIEKDEIRVFASVVSRIVANHTAMQSSE
jgi:DNA-binding MarR family transcriptional regulator